MKINRDMMAGFCCASLMISALIEASLLCDMQTVLFALMALSSAVFVCRGKRWAVWASLLLSAFLVADTLSLSDLTNPRFMLNYSPEILTFISAIILLIRKPNNRIHGIGDELAEP